MSSLPRHNTRSTHPTYRSPVKPGRPQHPESPQCRACRVTHTGEPPTDGRRVSVCSRRAV
ncbi:hypothetical protein B0H17DRAFT_1074742 [Mycena rosella]|uniref:Uncharacterized protein n=1 Tax=Mycena rosella TaxID=1033263 RepID=A0AAD7D7Q8_MYCRO|nr:hypothetical protein B0H17DRAFT_1074742 [Mycena rosella]